MPETTGVELLLAPLRVVTFALALLAALWVASGLARRAGINPAWSRNTTGGAVLLGLLAARLAHVMIHWPAYESAPWSTLYLWQPGYLPVAGLAAGALWLVGRLVALESPGRLRGGRAVVSGLAVGAVVLAGAYGGARWWSGAGVLRAGDQLPGFELVNLDGEAVSASDLRGQGVVLNFWATWCPPCRREMPLLESAWQEYREQGVMVVGIAVGQTPGEVRPFVDSTGVTYPIWLEDEPPKTDTWAMLERFGSAGLPTTVFIEPGGEIRDVQLGELHRSTLKKHLPELVP